MTAEEGESTETELGVLRSRRAEPRERRNPLPPAFSPRHRRWRTRLQTPSPAGQRILPGRPELGNMVPGPREAPCIMKP